MMDDDGWQYLVGPLSRITLGNAHETLLNLPVTVLFTINVPATEMLLHLDGETVGC